MLEEEGLKGEGRVSGKRGEGMRAG